MSISLFRSDRIEKLVEKLTDLMKANPQKNVFLPTEILIASDGMKHFINLSIAQKLGVASNIRYSKIHSFFWRILYESNKNKNEPFRHCYAPEILQWQILKIFQSDKMPNTVKKSVNFYLQSHDTAAYNLAQTMAKLFEQYMIYRPNWISAWSQNKLIGNLGKDEIWQKDLWLTIQESLDGKNRVELLNDLLKKLNNKTISFRLPERVFIFAPGALAPLYLQLLKALSRHTHIHLLVLAPSCAYWGDARKSDLDANPLLVSLGGQSRDFFDLLSDNNQFQFIQDEEDFCEEERNSLLHRVQYGIREYQPLENIEKIMPDNSIVLHSAYSPVRELHAVKDAILYFLQENQDCTLDDIAVLSPNIENYAPFIEAVFGENAADDIALPYSLADTAISVGSAYWQAWRALLTVFDSRFEVTGVWTLLENQAVLQCADLSLSDFNVIRQVIENSNIYFAWNSDERQKYGGYENEDLFSWSQALNRICAGLMLPETVDLWHKIAPLSLNINLLSIFQKFIALIEKVQYFRQIWQTKATVSEWVAYLQDIHQELLNDDSDDATHFTAVISNWQEQCEIAGLNEPLPSCVVATHLRNLLSNSTQKNFLRGGICFGSLVPLRSLPFKFLALLGMDANSFPRPAVKLPFDLMAKSSEKGDRSRRDDDRYLFLETLISARSVLYLSFVGKDIHNDSELAPSELIWELGDTLTVLTENTEEYWKNHTTQHPLQPFSPKYFADKEQVSGSLKEENLKKSFRKYADALNAINNKKEDKNQYIKYENNESIHCDWSTFLRFWKNPARHWLERYTNWKSPYICVDKNEREPFVVNHKQHGVAILTDYFEYGEQASERLIAQNYFPTAYLGENARKQYQVFVEKIKKENQTLGELLPFNIKVSGCLNEPINFSGSLNNIDLHSQKRIILDSTTNAEINANTLILLWLEHLVANVKWNEITSCIYRLSLNKKYFLLPMTCDKAQEYLNKWLEVYQIGQGEPIYFFPKSAIECVNAMFGKNNDDKRKQLNKWVIDKKPLSSVLPELNDFLYQIINKAHNKWIGNEYSYLESEYDAYKTLFHERNIVYTPLCRNLPTTPVNTAEFIELCVKLLLPMQEYFSFA